MVNKKILKYEQVSILQSIASVMTLTHDLEHVLNLAAEKSLAILEDGGCEIWVLERRTNKLHLWVHRRREERFDLARASLICKEDLSQLDEGMLVIDDVLINPLASQFIDPAEGFQSLAAFPLRVNGLLVGLLTLLKRNPGGFTDTELSLFAEMSGQLGIAIQNFFLYQDARQRADRIETLVRLRQELAQAIERNDFYESLANACIQLFDGAIGQVWLVDESAEVLRLHATAGQQMPESSECQLPLHEGFIGSVLKRKEPLASTNISQESRWPVATWRGEAGLTAYCSAPLLIGEEVLGILVVIRDEELPFSRWELNLLQHLGNQAAAAIQDSQLRRITQRHAQELEIKVQERTAQLERASQAKSEFLAAMSHELRTPLNGVIGFAELLRDQTFGPLNERQLRYVQHIHNSGHHLLALINDILDLSKVEAGELRLRREHFSLTKLLHSATVGMHNAASKKKLTISLQIEEFLPDIVADPIRVRQVIDNLLSNAIKFTPPGGTVRVASRMVHGWQGGSRGEPASPSESSALLCDSSRDFVEISVQDTGIGICPEDMPKLFTPFTQLDQSLARQHDGTGLGLALSKRLIELHGGSIWAESLGEGKGSTFLVLLPTETGAAFTQILLVDDDPNFRMALEIILSKSGYVVHSVSSGPEAIERVEESPYDLILLDLVLPQMDGREVLLNLKKENSCRNVPVIIFTGASETDPQEILRLGASEFLTKPFSEKVLIEVIKRITEEPRHGISKFPYPLFQLDAE